VIDGMAIFGPLIESHGEGGHIVSTASIAGLLSGASSPYSVTKYGVVALSEGLRNELAPKGIGVSVLCPGLIRTNIMDSARNLPERFEGATGGTGNVESVGAIQNLRHLLETQGLDPLYVGELVREGIENDWPYIFTDTQFEPMVEARFANIKQGFDRIRDRQPRR
jgi:NAD(P)-dependent dehydrogenase (short-subunit alcohol dehydrogenase family)